jgi:hypothetical protein
MLGEHVHQRLGGGDGPVALPLGCAIDDGPLEAPGQLGDDGNRVRAMTCIRSDPYSVWDLKQRANLDI